MFIYWAGQVMREVFVAGIGMTPFGKFHERGAKALAGEAIKEALQDAGACEGDIETAVTGNAVGGLVTGQEMIRGQVVLNHLGISGIPIVNVENACASASTALHAAWQQVTAGFHDIALAVGFEKLSHEDKAVSFRAIDTAVDLERRSEMADAVGSHGADRSFFMDIYADMGRKLMERTKLGRRDFARVVQKTHEHAALNPRAQYRNRVSLADVLESREIVWPLTLLMCSPIGDGAAAVVLASEEGLKRLAGSTERRRVKILASVLTSGRLEGTEAEKSAVKAARIAYEEAGVGPRDLDCVELHDATAPAELVLYEDLGFFEPDEISKAVDDGATQLGGALPINTSGGLLCKGHPIGATGLAQIVEIVEQLQARAGARQVQGARIGMAQNGGGWVGDDSAAAAVHILGV